MSHYAASCGNVLPTFRYSLSAPSSGVSNPKKTRPIGCPATSLISHHHSQHNNSEKRSSHDLEAEVWSPKWHFENKTVFSKCKISVLSSVANEIDTKYLNTSSSWTSTSQVRSFVRSTGVFVERLIFVESLQFINQRMHIQFHIKHFKIFYNTATCFDLDRSSSVSFVPC